MKSVQLDRKLSSTMARIPKRSTVVQSPSGRTAQSDDSSFTLFQAKPPVPSRKDQPLVDPVRGTVISRSTGASSSAKPSSLPFPTVSSPPLHHTHTPSASLHASPSRPSLNRATTAVRIVDEPQPLFSEPASHRLDPALGGAAEPTRDEEGLTLADLPKVLEAEQKREIAAETSSAAAAAAASPYRQQREQLPNGLPSSRTNSPPWQQQGQHSQQQYPHHQQQQYQQHQQQQQQHSQQQQYPHQQRDRERDRSPHVAFRDPNPSSAYATASSGPKLLSELSALEYFIVKHVAAVLLASESSALREIVTLEELLEMIDARKNTFWGKLFKGGEKKKEVKKKGAFVPVPFFLHVPPSPTTDL